MLYRKMHKKYLQSQTKNAGSASLEATLVMPVFLLTMVYLFLVFQCVLAETLVYEAAAQTAEYMAEVSYVEPCDIALAYLKFPEYIDEKEGVERYIKGGSAGVSFLGSNTLDEENCVVLQVSYQTKYAGTRTFRIRKRAYVGEDGAQGNGQEAPVEDRYVYVTDNQSVYHLTRNCTYLRLSIQMSALQQAKKRGYVPCHFCGSDCGETVYITQEGNCYHSRLNCSGLKRTIYRKKLSEVPGLGACQRCGAHSE